MSQSRFFAALGAALSLSVPVDLEAASSAEYPARPIRLIAPFPPGSPPDVVGRVFAERLTTSIGQAVLVDNRPGATGTIGMTLVARAQADGYTLGIIALPVVVAPMLLPKVPYDTLKDLVPVKLLAWSTNILVVRANAPHKSLNDVVAAARAKPGTITYASGGSGTPSHLAGTLLSIRTGVQMRHVPYRGAVEGVAGVLSEQVDLMFGATTAVGPYIESGRLLALATTNPQRLAEFPAVPTASELGFTGLDTRDLQGIVAPSGTPRVLIERLSGELERIKSLAEVRRRLAPLGMGPAGNEGPAEFGALLKSEVDRWGKVVREAGIRAD